MTQWIRQTKPLIRGRSVVDYVSGMSAIVGVVTGYRYVVSPLLKKYNKRLQQQDKPSLAKQPANKALVASIVDDKSLPTAVRVGVLLAFNGLLRVGEYTAPSGIKIEPGRTLLRKAVRFSAGAATASVRIVSSKGDTECKGPEMHFVSRPSDRYCVVGNLKQYTLWRDHAFPDSASLPLLLHPDGKYVTAADISAALRKHTTAAGLDPELYKPHCLRYGGAHEMCDNGISWEDIILAGRWKSDDAKRLAMHYAKFSVKRATAISKAMHIQGRASAQSFKPLFI